MRTYRLIEAWAEPATFYLPYLKNGQKVYQNYRLMPNTDYDEHADDELFIQTLKDAHKTLNYTKEREEILKRTGAKYKVKTPKCKCSGKKLDVWLVEVSE